MTKIWVRLLLPALVAASSLGCAGTKAQNPSNPTLPMLPMPALSARGELLYNTHCVACHTTQMHWRDDKQAKDWNGIQMQVRRWQAIAGLRWSDADITEVSRYLNNTIYKYPQTGDVVGLAANH